ncbi:MAG: laccase domain-containing protein [Chloroflexi bacterium]|nr:MAG: laccase domain-containing protein [Chloroflexota bacterium]TMF57404.1 MAG: laccase domain-containing protein [Chloroflexota bacterium]
MSKIARSTAGAPKKTWRGTWVERDGMLWSPLLGSLGLVAGFTTRAQGSLAGSRHPLEEQARNRAALARSLGFDGVTRVKQVHGRDVVRRDAPAEPWPSADALWTDRKAVLLAVAAADCVPVLVADPEGPIGAAHAGWQGTTLRVAEALVEALVAGGAARERLVASLGPAIGPCCYAIDMERAAVVNERIGEACLRKVNDRVVMDLWAANTAQLRSVGVTRIEISGVCTLSGDADLWSYRGRGPDGVYGTQLGFIGRLA